LEKNLTDKEKEVLTLIAEGLIDKEISDEIGISVNGVKKHCKNIYNKLGVNNRTLAAVKFVTEIKGK
jgi:two-component system, NarL family, response regulator LiaR